MKVGIMGSAADTLGTLGRGAEDLRERAERLGCALAARGCVVLTGATTGLPEMVGAAAHLAGGLHVGVSPAGSVEEHVERYHYPVENCDFHIYTGFGLKGRNVVLVRSSDIVIIVGGSMGALNEFTIAYDEGRIIGCLTSTGGVADNITRLIEMFPKRSNAIVLEDDDPERLLDKCISAM